MYGWMDGEHSTAERKVTGSIPGTDRDQTDTLSEKWEMEVTPLPYNGQTFAWLGWPPKLVVPPPVF